MVVASGVSVDVAGPGPTPEELDFRAIYQGGENFLARAKALSDLKAQHDAAYVNLRIGQDARAALDDGLRKQTEAASLHDQAATALEAATTTATDIVAKANDQAATILAEAKSAASAASASASQIMLDADNYATTKKATADAAAKRAAANEAETAKLKDAAQAALAAHQAARATADKSKADAEALVEAVRKKIDGMRQAIGEIAQ
jgi:hypothetical protein